MESKKSKIITTARINKPDSKCNNIIGKIIAEKDEQIALHISGYENCKQLGYSDDTISRGQIDKKGITLWLNKNEIEIIKAPPKSISDKKIIFDIKMEPQKTDYNLKEIHDAILERINSTQRLQIEFFLNEYKNQILMKAEEYLSEKIDRKQQEPDFYHINEDWSVGLELAKDIIGTITDLSLDEELIYDELEK